MERSRKISKASFSEGASVFEYEPENDTPFCGNGPIQQRPIQWNSSAHQFQNSPMMQRKGCSSCGSETRSLCGNMQRQESYISNRSKCSSQSRLNHKSSTWKTVVMVIFIILLIYNTVAVTYFIVTKATAKIAEQQPKSARLQNNVPDNFNAYSGNFQNSMCVPYKSVQLTDHEDEVLKKYTQTREGKQYACANNAEEWDEILQRMMERLIRIKREEGEFCRGTSTSQHDHPRRHSKNKECINEDKPAISLVSGRKVDQSGGPGVINNWISSQQPAFQKGVNVRNNQQIVVPKNGVYYVYCQIHFLEFTANQEQPTADKNMIYHQIVRFSTKHNARSVIFESRTSKCWAKNKEYNENTSFIGGLVHLKEGELVYVNVSNRELVIANPTLNVFGMAYITE